MWSTAASGPRPPPPQSPMLKVKSCSGGGAKYCPFGRTPFWPQHCTRGGGGGVPFSPPPGRCLRPRCKWCDILSIHGPSPPVLSPCSCLGCTSVSARLWRGPLSSNLGRYDHALQFSLLGTVIECSVRCLFNLCTLTCTQPLLWGCYRVVTARCIGGDASIYKYICI